PEPEPTPVPVRAPASAPNSDSGVMQQIEVSIKQSADDAEEELSGGRIYLGSSDLEMGGKQLVGLRFQDVQVPKGSVISEAYIQFEADEAGSTATQLNIAGEAVDTAAPFKNEKYHLTQRAQKYTKAKVAWSVSS